MWQKPTTNAISHYMRAVCRLSWKKHLKAKQASLLNKNCKYEGFKECLVIEGYKPWSEGLKRVQVCVIEKSNNCALAMPQTVSPTGSMWHRRCTKIILDKSSFSVSLHCGDCLDISIWMSGAECWSVSESRTENILASDSSLESSRFFRGW